jgi:beta-glucosidase
MFFPGTEGGSAAASLLCGDSVPCGKLTMSFPRSEGQCPIYYNHHRTANLRTDDNKRILYESGYIDSPNSPLYPFGYGLSYTNFEYSNLRLKKDRDIYRVYVDVKNIGDLAGAAVIELFVEAPKTNLVKPLRELRAFEKTYLEAGEEKTVEMTLDSRAYAYYNVAISDWHVESGDFKILVGASSRDIRLEDTVHVTSANPNAIIPDYKASAPYYCNLADNKDATEIPTEQFEVLYGEEIPENRPYAKGEFTIDSSVHDIKPSLVGNFIYTVLVAGVNIVAPTTENPEMLKHSIKDMPIRSFGGFTGGILSQMTMDGIVDMCNGTKGGFAKILKGFSKKNR